MKSVFTRNVCLNPSVSFNRSFEGHKKSCVAALLLGALSSPGALSLTISSPTNEDILTVGEPVTFVGQLEDGDLCTQYVWDFGEEGTVVQDSPVEVNSLSTTVTFNSPGIVNISFSGQDESCEGVSDPATLSISVASAESGNQAPTAVIDTPTQSQTINAGQSVNFTGTGRDLDGEGGVTFSWNFSGGAANSTQEDPGDVTFATPGNYAVTLTVTDDQGASTTSDSVLIVVQDSSEQPVDPTQAEITQALQAIAVNDNQRSVAQALGTACSQDNLDAVMQADCANLVNAAIGGDAGAASALSEITLDEVAAALKAILRSARMQVTNINTRLWSLRRGEKGASAKDLSVNISGQQLPVAALFDKPDQASGVNAGDIEGFGNWGFFVNGSVTVGEKDDTDSEAGYDFSNQGVTMGVDYRFDKGRVLGGALTVGQSNSELGSNGGELDGDNYSLTVYGSQYAGNYYFDASLSYGFYEFDQSRNISYSLINSTVNQSLVSDFGGNELLASVSGGYEFNFGALSLRPTAKFQYVNVELDAYQERSSNSNNAGWAVAVEDQREEEFAVSLGGHVDYVINQDWGVLIPTFQAEWIHEYSDDQSIINGRFVGDPNGTNFALTTDKNDQDFFTVGAGASVQLQNDKSAFIYYQKFLGQSEIEQDTITAGFRWEF